MHHAQVTGGLKLDPRAVECRFLGYAGGRGNYKVQDAKSGRVFVSCDVVFEEGEPHRTSPSVGENIPLFDTALGTLDEGDMNVNQHKRDIVTIPESHAGSRECHG